MTCRPKKFFFVPSPEDITLLKSVAASTREKKIRRQRAKILLLHLEGASYARIRQEAGASPPTIAKTLRKCRDLGVAAALNDLERSGRPAVIPDNAKDWMVALARKNPRDVPGGPDKNAWSLASLVAYAREHCREAGHPTLANVQRSSVWTWLNRRKGPDAAGMDGKTDPAQSGSRGEPEDAPKSESPEEA